MGSLVYDNEVPQHIQATAEFMRVLLGVDAWEIHLKMADEPKDGGVGVVSINYTYLRAHIEIRRDTPAKRQISATIHEFLHIVLFRIVGLLENMIEQQPSEQRQFLSLLSRDAEEQTVELLTRSIVAAGILPAMPTE